MQGSADGADGALLIADPDEGDRLHLLGRPAERAALERSGGQVPHRRPVPVGGDQNPVGGTVRDRHAADLVIGMKDTGSRPDDDFRRQRLRRRRVLLPLLPPPAVPARIPRLRAGGDHDSPLAGEGNPATGAFAERSQRIVRGPRRRAPLLVREGVITGNALLASERQPAAVP